MPDPTVYLVITNAPGCLPDGEPHLVTLSPDEANDLYESLSFELASDHSFYVADVLEIPLSEALENGYDLS